MDRCRDKTRGMNQEVFPVLSYTVYVIQFVRTVHLRQIRSRYHRKPVSPDATAALTIVLPKIEWLQQGTVRRASFYT